MSVTRRVGFLAGGAVALVVLLAVVLGLVLFGDDGLLDQQTYTMSSEAMAPTLKRGDRVDADEIAGADVRRGDIVVFSAPEIADELILKRVVGLPGEEISGVAGLVLIDGEVLDEPYLADPTTTDDFGPLAIPEGEVFVMGDNRPNSSDSRMFGSVPLASIVALVDAPAASPG